MLCVCVQSIVSEQYALHLIFTYFALLLFRQFSEIFYTFLCFLRLVNCYCCCVVVQTRNACASQQASADSKHIRFLLVFVALARYSATFFIARLQNWFPSSRLLPPHSIALPHRKLCTSTYISVSIVNSSKKFIYIYT